MLVKFPRGGGRALARANDQLRRDEARRLGTPLTLPFRKADWSVLEWRPIPLSRQSFEDVQVAGRVARPQPAGRSVPALPISPAPAWVVEQYRHLVLPRRALVAAMVRDHLRRRGFDRRRDETNAVMLKLWGLTLRCELPDPVTPAWLRVVVANHMADCFKLWSHEPAELGASIDAGWTSPNRKRLTGEKWARLEDRRATSDQATKREFDRLPVDERGRGSAPAVADLIGELPGIERQVMARRYQLGLSRAAAAERLGLSVRTVTRISRAALLRLRANADPPVPAHVWTWAEYHATVARRAALTARAHVQARLAAWPEASASVVTVIEQRGARTFISDAWPASRPSVVTVFGQKKPGRLFLCPKRNATSAEKGLYDDTGTRPSNQNAAASGGAESTGSRGGDARVVVAHVAPGARRLAGAALRAGRDRALTPESEDRDRPADSVAGLRPADPRVSPTGRRPPAAVPPLAVLPRSSADSRSGRSTLAQADLPRPMCHSYSPAPLVPAFPRVPR